MLREHADGASDAGDILLIDGHAHACGDYLRPEDIVRTLDSNGVGRVVLVPGQAGSTRSYRLPEVAGRLPSVDLVPYLNRLIGLSTALSGVAKGIPEGNCHVRRLVEACPDRVIQFYWVWPLRPETLPEVERDHAAWGFRGLKLHQAWEPFSIRSPGFEAVAAFAAREGLPIFLHLRSMRDVRDHIEFVRRHPEACFIIGHLFGLEEYIRSGMADERLYFDISAPPFVSRRRVLLAIEHLGARRIIMGSDTPYGAGNLRENIRRVRGLPISPADRRLILGGNLARLLDLDPSGG